MKYFDELKKSMEWLSLNDKVLFIGQSVADAGTFMFGTLSDVPIEKRIEFPVCESFQMQFSLGMAFSGYIPITIYPRLNFLMLAMGDMVNMIDKMSEMYSKYPKVIIRSAVGPDHPIHPGHQHIGDFTEAFKLIFKNIEVIKLEEPEDIFPAYQKAMSDDKSYLIIEVGNYYSSK